MAPLCVCVPSSPSHKDSRDEGHPSDCIHLNRRLQTQSCSEVLGGQDPGGGTLGTAARPAHSSVITESRRVHHPPPAPQPVVPWALPGPSPAASPAPRPFSSAAAEHAVKFHIKLIKHLKTKSCSWVALTTFQGVSGPLPHPFSVRSFLSPYLPVSPSRSVPQPQLKLPPGVLPTDPPPRAPSHHSPHSARWMRVELSADKPAERRERRMDFTRPFPPRGGHRILDACLRGQQGPRRLWPCAGSPEVGPLCRAGLGSLQTPRSPPGRGRPAQSGR